MPLKATALIDVLSGHQPANQDEMGGCVHCAQSPPGQRYGYSGRYLTDHAPDCAWVRARKYLGDNLPSSREAAFAVLRDNLPMSAARYGQLKRAARALVDMLIEQGFAASEASMISATESGAEWLACPTELRVRVLSVDTPEQVTVDLAGASTTVKLAMPVRPDAYATLAVGDSLFTQEGSSMEWDANDWVVGHA